MQVVLRCPNCGNAYDADERPATCEVCQAVLYGPAEPLKPTSDDPERFWEPLRALFDEFHL